MSAQIVFDSKDLREYIFSYLYSFDKLIETDNVYAFEIHKNKKKFTELINDYTMNDAVEYNSVNLVKWLHNNGYNCTEYAMDIAASEGNIELLEFLHNNRTEGCSTDAFIYAVEENQIEVIEWLHKNRLEDIPHTIYKNAIDIAIINGDLELTKYLYNIYINRFENEDCFNFRVISTAISSGNLLLVQWLDDKCKYYSHKESWIAAKKGYDEILYWLLKNRNSENVVKRDLTPIYSIYSVETNIDKTLVYACDGGHLSIVKFLCKYTTDSKILQEGVNMAALNGYIDIIIYLHNFYKDSNKNSYKNIYGKSVLTYAAKGGHLNIIKFIQKKSKSTKISNKNAMDYAALNGYLHIIEWLHNNRSEGCSIAALYNACKKGHFNIVKWLTYNKPELYCGKKAIDYAAAMGHYNIVEWLYINRNEGCSKAALNSSAMNGYLPIVEFLHQHGEICTIDAMNNAAMNGHLHIVKWLHENREEGCTTDAIDFAASHGHLEIVKWLHKNRYEGCTTNAMDLAASHGYLEIVKWLHENRNEGCTTNAIDLAAKHGHILVIKFLMRERKEGDTYFAIKEAYENNYITIAKLLRQHYCLV